MSELVQRLRERAAQLYEADRPLSDATLAADEIERLQARLKSFEEVDSEEAARLRAALTEITELCKTQPANPFLADNMDRVAQSALEQ